MSSSTETQPREGGKATRRRARGVRSLVDAARDIAESGVIEGVTRPGQLLVLFLHYQYKGKPIGKALHDWEFFEGMRFKRGTSIEEKRAAVAETRRKAAPTKPSGPGPDEGEKRPQGSRADLSTRQGDLERYGNKEVQPLPLDWPNAGGKDRRLWTEIVEEETARVIGVIAGEVHQHALAPIEATTLFRAVNHMVTKVIEAGHPDDKFTNDGPDRPRRKPGECNGQLMILYRHADWRDWMRSTLLAYLISKEKQARSEIDLQLYGDVPSDAEDASQEPAHKPEDETQLIAATSGPARGDAFEGD